jgi:hypothetical protein
MSKIYVSEYAGLGQTDQSDSVNILPVPASVEYTVIVSAGSSGAAQPILFTTKFIELRADTTCSFVIGTSGGSAGLGNCRLNANESVIRRVPNVPQMPSNQYQPAPAANFIFTTANV